MKPEEQLAAWSEGWVADGLVTPAQRDAILARHPKSADGGTRLMTVLLTIGGALLVIGINLLVAANWEKLGDWVKIGSHLAMLLGVYYLGWRLKISPGKYPRTGDACFMIGAVGFLLGIALVSQVFHIDSRPPNGILLWWAGIVVLPWLTRAKGMQFVSLVAGVTWLGMEMASDDSVLMLAGAYGNRSDEYLPAAAAVLVGFAVWLFGLGLRDGPRRYFAGMHEKVGLLLACWGLYFLGFTWSVDTWFSFDLRGALWPAVAVITLLAAAGATWAWLRNFRELRLLGWALLPPLVPTFAHLLGIDLGDSGWLWGGVACLSLFLLNIRMIQVGLESGRESWINLGIGFIALNIITRYFLLFGTMLDGGVFFIVSGLLVIGLGWYLERKRRALLGAMRKEASS